MQVYACIVIIILRLNNLSPTEKKVNWYILTIDVAP